MERQGRDTEIEPGTSDQRKKRKGGDGMARGKWIRDDGRRR